MKKINKSIFFVLAGVLVCMQMACKNEFTNPNAPDTETVLTSTKGLLASCNGLRARYSLSGSLYNSISASGLSTGELRVVNAGNADLQGILLGGNNVTNTNSTLNSLWTGLNILNADCDKILANVNNVPNVSVRNSIQAYAHLFKALAIGRMSAFWENVVVTSSEKGSNASFEKRAVALQTAIKLCDDAVALLGSSPLPVEFTSVVGTDLDLLNCLNALSARYNSMLLKNAEALAAANKVSLVSTSTFKFDNVSTNPMYRSSFVNNNTTQAVANLGLTGVLAPEAGDGRIPFYLITTGTFTPASPGGKGFYKSDADPIPFYLPGEITLIKAEAYARAGATQDIAKAVEQINIIRQKTTDPLGVNASLGAYSGPLTETALLGEIYKLRCIELYLSGLKLEDSRRFGRPGPGEVSSERSRNYYPYPATERNNNPNTPADPAL